MQGAKRYTPDPAVGLSHAQALERSGQGLVNTQPPTITKSTGQLLREHLCTFFNAINAGIFVALLLVGSYTNITFMFVVLANLLVGVVQEVRSKRMVERLTLLHTRRTTVIREGAEQDLSVDEIVLDDVISLKLGDQIPTDCVILRGAVEVDESLLTGESEPIRHGEGGGLLSGSVIVAGACRARVDKIGEEGYASALTAEAKKARRIDSALMRSLRTIIRFAGGFVLPLGVLMFLRAFVQLDHSLQSSVEQAAASMLGMIPSGLMLLTSVSLAAGVIALTRKGALVQETYAIETLARVNMLCLDKTGTLTTGEMRVTEVRPLGGAAMGEVEELMANYVAAVPGDNVTARALRERFYAVEAMHALGITPFSSARRYSAASFARGAVYVGAPEALFPGEEALLAQAGELASQGFRVLALAVAPPAEDAPRPIQYADARPTALLLLQDVIREEAAATLRFFLDEDVQIRIISGDDPRTVAHIAARLELPGCGRYVDASTLRTDEELTAAATEYTVFGRVSPQQKRTLCRALKAAGNTVAMTGDGVNDLLALREADCSIALMGGSDAAQQAAHIVLLTNDFSALPGVVMEGRRVINNITRMASLFLVKTIYSFLLTVSSVVFAISYPFQPVQLSLISVAAVGVPSFFLALAPNRARVSGSFLRNVLTNALPGALIVYAYALFAGIVGPRFGLAYREVNTLCVYLAGTASLCVLLRVCLPLNRWRAALWIGMTALFFGSAVFLRGFFGMVLPAKASFYIMYGIMAAACYPLMLLLTQPVRAFMRSEALDRAMAFMRRVGERLKGLWRRKSAR